MSDFVEIVLGKTERGRKSSLVVFWLVLAVYAWNYRGPAEGYWDTYIAVPAALIAGDPVDFRTADGKAAFNYELSGKLPDDLVRKDAYGIATKDQRLGPAVVASPFYKFFRLFGFRFFYALIPALTALAFFCFLHRLTTKRLLSGLAAVLLVLNPFLLSYQRLNPNFIGLFLVAVMFLVIEEEPFRPFLAGLLCGAFGGIRNEGIIYAPILLFWVAHRGADASAGSVGERRRASWKSVAWFVAGGLVTIAPFLYWKQFAFGSPFMHPSQYAHFEGFRPTFPHSFLGIEFQFNGLLNVPFYREWVRTPHFPYPVFLMIPMVALTTFGLLLNGLAVLGVRPLVVERKRLAAVMLAWLVVTWLFWGFQENWEELKMSFLFMGLPPLLVLMVFGAARMAVIGRLKANLGAYAAFLLVAVVLLKFAHYMDFPVDDRWYDRFPKARVNSTALPGLPDDRRLDPEFFLTREDNAEHERQKARFSNVCLLPCSYLPVQRKWEWLGGDPAAEMSQRRLTVHQVWEIIYAQHDKAP